MCCVVLKKYDGIESLRWLVKLRIHAVLEYHLISVFPLYLYSMGKIFWQWCYTDIFMSMRVYCVCEPEHIVSRWHVHGGNLCKIQLCCAANLWDSGAIGQYYAFISILDIIFFRASLFLLVFMNNFHWRISCVSFLSAALLIFVIIYQSILSVFVVVTTCNMSYFHRKITQTNSNKKFRIAFLIK